MDTTVMTNVQYKSNAEKNKLLHINAAKQIENVKKWTISMWEWNVMKLEEIWIGSKLWWNIIQYKQGEL